MHAIIPIFYMERINEMYVNIHLKNKEGRCTVRNTVQIKS